MLNKYIRIEFCGESPERFINMCKHRKIKIWGLESKENKYSCYIYAKEFRNLKSFARKTKVHVRILERHGAAFYLFHYRKRKGFFLGLIIAISIIWGLSRFIWKIDIDGNTEVTDDVLYEYLREEKIYYGMYRNNVDCELICKKLRINFQEIIWVSASLEGTNLNITIKEGTEAYASSNETVEKYDVVANVDGIIYSMVTRKGAPKVAIGDYVKKGDILVSGTLEIKNDAGETIKEEHTCADADIWIKHSIPYYSKCDNMFWEKQYDKSNKILIGIRIGDVNLRFGIQNKNDNQEQLSEFYPVVLNDGFILPIELELKKTRDYRLEKRRYAEDTQRIILREQYNNFCKELLENNIEIMHEDIKYYTEKEWMIYQGQLEVIQQVVDLY